MNVAPSGGPAEIAALRLELARTRRLLKLLAVVALVAVLGLGYCAKYFRKRCNGFEKKLDSLYLMQLTKRNNAGAPNQPAAVAAAAAAASTFSAPGAPATQPIEATPVAAWSFPALPGGLPPAVDIGPLLAPLAKSDAAHPSRPLFDELDLFEQGNRLFYENASYYFRTQGSYSGSHCFEIQLEEAPGGFGRIIVQPRYLKVARGEKLSLAFRKSRPDARLWMGLITHSGPVFVHEAPGATGLDLALASTAAWRELDLDLYALAAAQKVDIGDGRVTAVFFGLTHAAAGDSLFFDRVWTGPSAVQGLPVPTGKVSIAGRVSGPTDGVTVTLVRDASVAQAAVSADGSFAFRDLPAGAVVELWAEKAGKRFFASTGDVMHVTTDVADAHILTEDLAALRSPGPVKPEWSNYGGPGVEKYGTQFPPHKPMFYTGVIGQPLEYSNSLIPNRFGAYDRDHRFEDPDQRQRILILGDCQLEGIQSELCQRVGPRLESILRRRYGRDVEVLTLAHSNAHPAAVWPMYEKLGKLFLPDVVLLDVNAPSIIQMEPRLLKNVTGWDPEHSAYASFQLGPDDVLKFLPGDPNYPMYAGKPTYAQIEGVPSNWVMHVEEAHFSPEAKALTRIMKAVVSKYAGDARTYGARVATYTGARAANYLNPATYEGKAASQKNFVENMTKLAREAGAVNLDITSAIMSHPQPETVHFWKKDGHPTPTGHYWVAEGLAQQLMSTGLVH